MNERNLTPVEKDIVKTNIDDAIVNLNLDMSHDNSEIVSAIDSFVLSWQKKRRTRFSSLFQVNSNAENIANSLGCLWGNSVYKELGWEWIVLEEDGNDYLVVANKTRSMVIYPIEFVSICLKKPLADCTIELSFNMLRAQRVPEDLKRGSYENIMGRIAHIVPS